MSVPSEEEKKALIIKMTRRDYQTLCSAAGTQEPVLFIHPNADGTGSLTEIWESEEAVVKTLLPAAASTNNMTYEQRKRFVLDSIMKDWDHPGVNFAIIKDYGLSPPITKAILSFPTYQELLDKMYESSKQGEQRIQQEHAQQQQQMQMLQQQMQMQQQQNQQFQFYNAQRLQMKQQMGMAPTHYENGVPHYNGGVGGLM